MLDSHSPSVLVFIKALDLDRIDPQRKVTAEVEISDLKRCRRLTEVCSLFYNGAFYFLRPIFFRWDMEQSQVLILNVFSQAKNQNERDKAELVGRASIKFRQLAVHTVSDLYLMNDNVCKGFLQLVMVDYPVRGATVLCLDARLPITPSQDPCNYYFEVYRKISGSQFIAHASVPMSNRNPLSRVVASLCPSGDRAGEGTETDFSVRLCYENKSGNRISLKEEAINLLVKSPRVYKVPTTPNSSTSQTEITVQQYKIDTKSVEQQIDLIFALDMSQSNGHPSSTSSRHHIDPTSSNVYEQCVMSLFKHVVQHTRLRSVELFGICAASLLRETVVSTYFRISSYSPAPLSPDLIVADYQRCVAGLQFGEPTVVSPMIGFAYDQHEASPGRCPYTFLVIITDGLIEDLSELREMLNDMDKRPVSILFVVVGHDAESARLFIEQRLLPPAFYDSTIDDGVIITIAQDDLLHASSSYIYSKMVHPMLHRAKLIPIINHVLHSERKTGHCQI